jgi:tetratricopeptide (TPR) repeat protein
VSGLFVFAFLLPVQVRAQDSDTQSIIEAARAAARADKNAESAELFKKVIEKDPSLRMVVLRELADQMTYSGRAKDAVPLYKEFLASGNLSPEQGRWARLGLALALSWSGQLTASMMEYSREIARAPKDVEARLGRARVFSWMDMFAESKAEYNYVLRLDPANAEAQKGLARVDSWRGRQREAQARLSSFVREHPNDAEARILLAQSQDWMGRPDLAEEGLQEVLRQSPGNQDAQRKLAEINLRKRPDTRVDFRVSTQSDGLVITQLNIEQNFRFNGGRTTVGPRFQNYFFDAERDVDNVSVKRPGLFARHRFNNWSEINGDIFLDSVKAKRAGVERKILTYDTWLTLWPNDVLRFDISSSRTTFDNVKSLTQRLTATYAGASADYTPTEKMKFSGRYNYGFFSDENRRQWWQFEGERRVRNNPRLLVGGRYTGISFARQLDNGYFNPKIYQSIVGTLHTWGNLRNRFYYDFDGSYGFEHAEPGGDKPLYSAGTRLTYRFTKRFELSGVLQRFSSRQASSSGFARTTAGTSGLFIW